jgi:hypothetical protein
MTKIKNTAHRQRKFLNDLEDGKVDLTYIDAGHALSPKSGLLRSEITAAAYALAPDDVLERLIKTKIVDSPEGLKRKYANMAKNGIESRPLFDMVEPRTEERFLLAIKKGWTFAVVPTLVAFKGIKYVKAYDAIVSADEWKEHVNHGDCFVVSGDNDMRDHIVLRYKYVPPSPNKTYGLHVRTQFGTVTFPELKHFYTPERVKKYADAGLWTAEEALQHAEYFANTKGGLFRAFIEARDAVLAREK